MIERGMRQLKLDPQVNVSYPPPVSTTKPNKPAPTINRRSGQLRHYHNEIMVKL